MHLMPAGSERYYRHHLCYISLLFLCTNGTYTQLLVLLHRTYTTMADIDQDFSSGALHPGNAS